MPTGRKLGYHPAADPHKVRAPSNFKKRRRKERPTTFRVTGTADTNVERGHATQIACTSSPSPGAGDMSYIGCCGTGGRAVETTH